MALDEFHSAVRNEGTKPVDAWRLVFLLLPWMVIGAYCLVGWLVIWRNPLEIGGDEGMELSKALVVARAPEQLPKVWNDQPWFYSMVFGKVFRSFGFLPLIPRMASLLCVALYCGWMRRLMPVTAGPWHHTAGVLLFLTFPSVMSLSVSAMCELPATLLGLIGATALFNASGPWRRILLIAGGVLLGVAINIKLTAAMVFGAATIAFVICELARANQSNLIAAWKPIVSRYATWLAAR